MHDLDATRIFWKEWRAQRSFWLGLLALAIVLESLLIFVTPLWRPTSLLEQLRYHEGLAAVLACAFATGSAAIAFAGEVEAKTKGLLQRVPVRARDLLAGKLTFSLAGSYSLFLALWLLGGLLLSESRSLTISRAIQAQTAEGPLKPELEAELRAKSATEAPLFDVAWLAENVRGPLAFVVVGSLVSLLLSDVLLTVLIAGVVTSVLVAIPIVRDSLLVQGTVIAAALVCDFLLARRWLIQTGAVEWRWLPQVSFPRVGFGHRPAIAEYSASLECVRSPVAWRRVAGSLIWKEFRQAYLFCLAILIIGLIVIVLTPLAERTLFLAKGSATLLTWVLLLAPLLTGVAAMRAERKGGAYQLLANHAVGVDGFVACKHFVWLGLSFAVFGILLLVDEIFLAERGPSQTLSQTAHEVARETFGFTSPGPTAGLLVAGVHVMLLYALGFVLALLLPGPIVAFFAGVLIEIAIVLGWTIVARLQIPFWWTVGLFPFILLAVGWVRMSDWLIGRGRSAWWKVAAVFFLPVTAIAAATAAYRVWEIPAAVVPKAVLEAESEIGAIQSSPAKRSLFVDAMNALSGPPPKPSVSDKEGAEDGWQSAARADQDWVDKNSRARQLALDAVQLPPGSFGPPLGNSADDRVAMLPYLRKMGWLADLLLSSARKFEFEDQLDEALKCYVAVARLGKDAAHSYQGFPGINENRLTLMSLNAMPRWAMAPKQSTQRVQEAIRDFALFEPSPSTPTNSVLRDWQIDRSILHAAIWGPLPTDRTNQSVAQFWWVRWFFPWELVRLERVDAAVYAAELEEADTIGSELKNQGFVSMTAERAAKRDRNNGPWKYDRTTLALPDSLRFWRPEHFVDRLAQERMGLVVLAIADFKRVHKKRPESLQALVPTYFKRLPIDPWTGGDFLYEPNGLPNVIVFPQGGIEPHVAFLASAGMTDCRLVRRLTTANATPSFEVVSRFSSPGNLTRGNAPFFDGPMVKLP